MTVYASIKKIIVFVIFFYLNISTFGQVKDVIQLGVGDTLPDIEVGSIINYKSPSIRISKLRGKHVILDFWATWCGPCISAISKNDSIRKSFKDDLLILPITYEEKEKVTEFLNRMKGVIPISMITVTNDSLLSALFKHTTLPHYVWIDDSQRIIAITQGDEVNKNNISSFVRNNPLRLKLKVDAQRTLVKVPAFPPSIQVKNDKDTIIQKLDNSSIIFNSVLTNYVDGFNGGGSFRDSTYISIRNGTIAQLYKVALFGNSMDVINSSTVRVEVSDSVLYMKILGTGKNGQILKSGLESLNWLKLNAFCYESSVPTEMAQDRFNIMREELNKYFGVKLGIIGLKDSVNRKCLSLKIIDKNKSFASNGAVPSVECDRLFFKMQNMYISTLKDQLAFPLQAYPPIVDETGITGRLDIEIHCNLSDPQAVNKELERYGLTLVEKEMKQETGIIRMKEKVSN